MREMWRISGEASLLHMIGCPVGIEKSPDTPHTTFVAVVVGSRSQERQRDRFQRISEKEAELAAQRWYLAEQMRRQRRSC